VAHARIEELELQLSQANFQYSQQVNEHAKTNSLLELVTEKCKKTSTELWACQQINSDLKRKILDQAESIEELKGELDSVVCADVSVSQDDCAGDAGSDDGSHVSATSQSSRNSKSSVPNSVVSNGGGGATTPPRSPLLRTHSATTPHTHVSNLDLHAADIANLSKQLSKQVTKRDGIIADLTLRLEKSEESLAKMSERYLRTAQRNEASAVETELVETKMALAQACSKRDVLTMKVRTMEKEYVKLKLELAEARSREDDQIFVNDVLKTGVGQLEAEVKEARRANSWNKSVKQSILQGPDLTGVDVFSRAIRSFMTKQKRQHKMGKVERDDRAEGDDDSEEKPEAADEETLNNR
jgi:hypothetical protein